MLEISWNQKRGASSSWKTKPHYKTKAISGTTFTFCPLAVRCCNGCTFKLSQPVLNTHIHVRWGAWGRDCTGLAWARINFLHGSSYPAMFWLCDQTSLDNWGAGAIQSGAHTVSRPSLALRLHGQQGGWAGRGQTQDSRPRWLKGCPMPCGVALSSKSWGKDLVMGERHKDVGSWGICAPTYPLRMKEPCFPGNGKTSAFRGKQRVHSFFCFTHWIALSQPTSSLPFTLLILFPILLGKSEQVAVRCQLTHSSSQSLGPVILKQPCPPWIGTDCKNYIQNFTQELWGIPCQILRTQNIHI